MACLVVTLLLISPRCLANDRVANQSPHYVFENSVPIMGVLKEKGGRTQQKAELITLTLKIQQGSGQIFSSLGVIQKPDTQISLRLAHQTTCDVFDLPCGQYDFFYEFDLGESDLVGGQSASAAAAYLLAKTLKNESIDPDAVITGSLTPGGIIGRVDGVETKILQAQFMGFATIYIPANSFCKNSPVCNGFRLNHYKCEVNEQVSNTSGNQVVATISCPKKNSIGQYALKLRQCAFDRSALSKGDTELLLNVSCLQSFGGRDVRVSYEQCKVQYKKPDNYNVLCSIPHVEGFIDVVRVTGLDQLVNRRTPKTELLTQLYTMPTLLKKGEGSMLFSNLATRLFTDMNGLADDEINEALNTYIAADQQGAFTNVSHQLTSELMSKRPVDQDNFKVVCQHIIQRIKLTSLTLDKIRSSRFSKKIASLLSLSINDIDYKQCFFKGSVLEAEISVSINFLDMGEQAKQNFITQLMLVASAGIEERAINQTYPFLPMLCLLHAEKEKQQGNLDKAYFMATVAITLAGNQQFLEKINKKI